MDERARALAAIDAGELTPAECAALLAYWPFWRRPSQAPPLGAWRGWLILAGRGYGKTRVGSEETLSAIRSGARRVALVGRTAADVRDTMIEGESGLAACCRPGEWVEYIPSKRRAVVHPYRAVCLTFADESPDQLRGPQFDFAWCDEAAAWRYGEETFANLEMALRLGRDPRWVTTTTPRPVPLIRDLAKRGDVRVTRGSTFENAANLPASTIETLRRRYEGTRIGRQELYAEVLDDVAGALWTHAMIDVSRVREAPPLVRIVVAIDPSVTSGESADVTGIVAAGIDSRGHIYVLDDISARVGPAEWAQRAVKLARDLKADRVVAEGNNGGEMIALTLRQYDRNLPVRTVYASRGKVARAEPVAALYEQKRVHHVGVFADLEAELTSWVQGDDSPGRLDALVWACYDLALGSPVGTWADVKPPSKPHAPARSAVRF